ncbi:MAG: (Fe-S)-binding protein [Candidatus Thorarchaeota archaeon]|jgi:acetyl-CoA decarbonylase/synthase complex subunit gamma
MAKLAGPLDIYPTLPGTNCGDCGEANCMAFATKLAEYTVKVAACTPLYEAKYAKKLAKLEELIRPPVKEVMIGIGDKAAAVGGKLVLYRHDLRYSNETSFFMDVADNISSEAIASRVKAIEDWSYVYIGQELKLDGIALRGVSKDPATFAKAAKQISELSSWPIILCSLDPTMLSAAADAIADKRPLLYAATMDTWTEVGGIAAKHGLPLVAYAPGNLDNLTTLVGTLRAMGVEDLVLDPGNAFRAGLGTTIDNFSMLRRSATVDDDELVGYPLLATPITVWADYREGEAPPMTFLRSNLYTDPVKPVAVEAGLMKFGEAGPDSPLMYTTNFALTYFTVESDIKQGNVDAWLLVVDTEGMSVQSAVAGRKLTAEKVAEAIEEYRVTDKVKHRILVSPGMAARISGETEEASGWTVKVGFQNTFRKESGERNSSYT